MPQHIGIAACSAEGAALCFRTICLEGEALMGEHWHPEVTMHVHPLGQYMEHVGRGDWPGVATLMLSSAEKLAAAGADFIICPDNTIHQAFDLVVGEVPTSMASHSGGRGDGGKGSGLPPTRCSGDAHSHGRAGLPVVP